jgi:hypothetical protein
MCLSWGVHYSRTVLGGIALLGISLTGCSSAVKTAQTTLKAISKGDGKLYAVSADSAAFFQHGPQQGREPDKKLPRETLLKVIRPSFCYCKVQLVSSGEQGYVASEEIKLASPTLIASTTSSHAEPPIAPTPSVEQFNLNSDDPRLVPPPEELPDPDLPAPGPDQ